MFEPQTVLIDIDPFLQQGAHIMYSHFSSVGCGNHFA
jgi:hypothetical protein